MANQNGRRHINGYVKQRKLHGTHFKRDVSYSVLPRKTYSLQPAIQEDPIIEVEPSAQNEPVKIEIQSSDAIMHNIEVKSDPKPTVDKKQRATSKKKSKKTKEVANYEKRQTVERHVDELRRRGLYCIVALTLGGLVGYRFQNEIIAWLVKPLGQQLFYTSPTGGFDFLIKICLFFGFLLAIPVIIYNIIRFLAPAVPKRVSYSTSKILIISIILALCGVAFAYFISLPSALYFLNNFTNDQVQSLISAQEYFNFVMIYLAGFAVLFQMPLIFAFVNKITPLKPQSLIKKQRLVILVSFIIAAILTPTPDPMNQTLMAIPIIGLYQTSIGVVWQDNKRTRRKDAKRYNTEALAAA